MRRGELVKFYQQKGAVCSGLELSDARYNNAILLDNNNLIHLSRLIFVICSYKDEITGQYNTIILRDVIEHIPDKELALRIFILF